ncbi:uncharacterized protein BN773_01148 [Prevotella sp. CAG:755]|nr:uncharacterized protein BN773_01148 [Prevotella sp. CAG:755]
MRKKQTLLAGLLLSGVLLLSASCASRQRFVYVNDMVPGMGYAFDVHHEAVVHADDRLGITVACKNPELALPFNIHSGSFRVGADGEVSAPSGSQPSDQGYRVDADGYIDFPILGRLHVEGLRVSEVTSLIRQKIISGNYIKDPLVSLEFLNFRYTVLGAVSRNGTFTVEGDRVTLLEAIANAGNLSASADMGRVTVIREEGGARKQYVHDLRSTDIFKSPCYYLQQNDIVYVEPKYRRKSAEDRGWQISATLISLASLGVSLIWALK